MDQGLELPRPLAGPNGETADHPSMQGRRLELLAFDFSASDGGTDVSVQRWDNVWSADVAGLHPSDTSRLAGFSSGDFDAMFLADDPGTATGVYGYQSVGRIWGTYPSVLNPSGLPMEHPVSTACYGFQRVYLAFQTGQTITIEAAPDQGPWTLNDALAQVTLPTGVSNVRLRDIRCASDGNPYGRFITPLVGARGDPGWTDPAVRSHLFHAAFRRVASGRFLLRPGWLGRGRHRGGHRRRLPPTSPSGRRNPAMQSS